MKVKRHSAEPGVHHSSTKVGIPSGRSHRCTAQTSNESSIGPLVPCTCRHRELSTLHKIPCRASGLKCHAPQDEQSGDPLKSPITMTVPPMKTSRPACHVEALQYRPDSQYGERDSRSDGSGSRGNAPWARLATSAWSDSQPH